MLAPCKSRHEALPLQGIPGFSDIPRNANFWGVQDVYWELRRPPRDSFSNIEWPMFFF